jgi:hypothetical protein
MLYRSNAYLHHTGISLRRESAAQAFSFRCSATELQLLSSLVGIEPTTVGSVEVPRAFTTPQTLGSFSFPPYFTTSLFLFRAHPYHPHTTQHLLAKSVRFQIPGGISAHGLSGFEPEGQSAFLTKK